MEMCNTRVHVTHSTEAQINCNVDTVIANVIFDRSYLLGQDRHLTGCQGKSPEKMTFNTDFEGS